MVSPCLAAVREPSIPGRGERACSAAGICRQPGHTRYSGQSQETPRTCAPPQRCRAFPSPFRSIFVAFSAFAGGMWMGTLPTGRDTLGPASQLGRCKRGHDKRARAARPGGLTTDNPKPHPYCASENTIRFNRSRNGEGARGSGGRGAKVRLPTASEPRGHPPASAPLGFLR
jgi:hypothetical protein